VGRSSDEHRKKKLLADTADPTTFFEEKCMRKLLTLFFGALLTTSLVALSSTPASSATTLITCTDLTNQKTVVLKESQKGCKSLLAPALWHIQQSDSPAHSGDGYAKIRVCSSRNQAVTYQFIKKSCPRYQVSTDYWRSITSPSIPLIVSASAVGFDGAVFTLASTIQATDAPIAYYLVTNVKTGQVNKVSPNNLGQLSIVGLNPLTSYTFQIAAVSVDGTSSSSNTSQEIRTEAVPVTSVAPTAASLATPAFTLSSASEIQTAGSAIAGYTISSTGGTIASYSISPAAPAGLTFSTSTGLLSGTPTTVAGATAYTITATNASGSATRTFTLTVSPGAASKALMLTQPAGAVSGSVFTTQPVVKITDTNGNLVTTSSAVVTVSKTSGSGTLRGTLTATAVAGIATFTNLAITGTGDHLLTFTPAALTAANSATLTVAIAAPSFTLSSASEIQTAGSAIAGYTISSTGGTIASYSISPAAPAGLTFSTSTGLLSGTPSTIARETIYTITATNASGSATRTFTLRFRGPGGGIVFYVAASDFTSTGSTCNTTCRYLEVAPSTWQSAGVIAEEDIPYQWSTKNGPTGQDATMVTAESSSTNEKLNWQIGQGFENTRVMRVSGASSAAQTKVLAYAGGGFAGQWFIPSRNELNELCKYANGLETGDPKVACILGNPSQIRYPKSSVEGFADYYWSSTEFDSDNSWYLSFGTGNSGTVGKLFEGRIRPIRAFGPLPPPAFTLTSSAETKTVNTSIAGYTISSTGGTIASYSISPAAPAGLTFSTSTGLLSGTPTTVAGATAYTITATNASGSATRTFTLAVKALIYTVGQTGPGGGKIFYVAPTPFACGPTRAETCTYLEAAPALWNVGASDPERSWANTTYQNVIVNNADSPETAFATAIGWGYRNTRAIIQQGNSDSTTSAAALADSYTLTVSGVIYDDWYLPDQQELNQMCKWARGITGSDLTDLTVVCNGGTPNSELGFLTGFYWSSTHGSSSGNAYFQIFAEPTFLFVGFQGTNGKYGLNNVRPIRAF
jgi:hypothetical protein